MAKLGLAMIVGALAAARAPAAPPLTADEALARQQSSLRTGLGLDCDRGAAEIVICGRTGQDPNRLPLPVQPEPGARNAGEPSNPNHALALSDQKCTTVGRDQHCSGGLPILPIAIFLVQTAVKAVKGRE
ncbi:MAG TPA: hypothetical protein VF620_10530 [Allosphingosinicella sp.]|jgi:hypothetical protein